MRILIVAPDGYDTEPIMTRLRADGQEPMHPSPEATVEALATVGGYYLCEGWATSARCRAIDLLARDAGLRRYGRINERSAP